MARRESRTATTPRVGRRPDEPARPLGQQGGGPGQVDGAEGAGAGPVAAGLEEGVVGPGEGEPVEGHQREGGPGHVDPLPERHGGEQAGGVVGGEGVEELGLGQVVLGQDLEGQHRAQGVGGLVHGAPAREQRQGAAPGGA